jgi:hypothetical protein
MAMFNSKLLVYQRVFVDMGEFTRKRKKKKMPKSAVFIFGCELGHVS